MASNNVPQTGGKKVYFKLTRKENYRVEQAGEKSHLHIKSLRSTQAQLEVGGNRAAAARYPSTSNCLPTAGCACSNATPIGTLQDALRPLLGKFADTLEELEQQYNVKKVTDSAATCLSWQLLLW
jgi:hypothetical protein